MTVSRHFLRRTARKKRERCMTVDPAHRYLVVRAERGPFRWTVVRKPKETR